MQISSDIILDVDDTLSAMEAKEQVYNHTLIQFLSFCPASLHFLTKMNTDKNSQNKARRTQLFKVMSEAGCDVANSRCMTQLDGVFARTFPELKDRSYVGDRAFRSGDVYQRFMRPVEEARDAVLLDGRCHPREGVSEAIGPMLALDELSVFAENVGHFKRYCAENSVASTMTQQDCIQCWDGFLESLDWANVDAKTDHTVFLEKESFIMRLFNNQQKIHLDEQYQTYLRQVSEQQVKVDALQDQGLRPAVKDWMKRKRRYRNICADVARHDPMAEKRFNRKDEDKSCHDTKSVAMRLWLTEAEGSKSVIFIDDSKREREAIQLDYERNAVVALAPPHDWRDHHKHPSFASVNNARITPDLFRNRVTKAMVGAVSDDPHAQTMLWEIALLQADDPFLSDEQLGGSSCFDSCVSAQRSLPKEALSHNDLITAKWALAKSQFLGASKPHQYVNEVLMALLKLKAAPKGKSFFWFSGPSSEKREQIESLKKKISAAKEQLDQLADHHDAQRLIIKYNACLKCAKSFSVSTDVYTIEPHGRPTTSPWNLR